MRLLVVHAHPVPDSLNAALFRAAVEGADGSGHEVRAVDLGAEGFEPVMGEAEKRGYDEGREAEDSVLRRHGENLRWAEGIVLVFPTWWSGPPAILKGWIDRAWRPGVAFHTGEGGTRPGLGQVRVLGVVTTLGATRWQWSVLLGAPGRKALLRGLLLCTGLRTRTFWLALHDVDKTSQEERQRFLARVRARMARL